MLLEKALFYSFEWLRNSPLYLRTMTPLTMELSMVIFLASSLAGCRWCCREHSGVCVCCNSAFSLYLTQEWEYESCGTSFVHLLRNFHTVFCRGCYQFSGPQKGA